MRTLGLAVLFLIAGSAVRAQSVKPADLVARWVEVGDTTRSYTDFRADFTFSIWSTFHIPTPPGTPPVPNPEINVTGVWHLAVDTLIMITQKAAAKGNSSEWQDWPVPPGGGRASQQND
jgi:hypothetical protein